MGTNGVLVSLFAYAGVEPATCDGLLRDLHGIPNAIYNRVSRDALISRSRSTAASGFLRVPETVQVMIMVDHDISWQPTPDRPVTVRYTPGQLYSNKLHIYDVTIFQCSLTGQR